MFIKNGFAQTLCPYKTNLSLQNKKEQQDNLFAAYLMPANPLRFVISFPCDISYDN
jgi:hypothetical protein